jgi:hypothetical protein
MGAQSATPPTLSVELQLLLESPLPAGTRAMLVLSDSGTVLAQSGLLPTPVDQLLPLLLDAARGMGHALELGDVETLVLLLESGGSIHLRRQDEQLLVCWLDADPDA